MLFAPVYTGYIYNYVKTMPKYLLSNQLITHHLNNNHFYVLYKMGGIFFIAMKRSVKLSFSKLMHPLQ